MWRGSQYFSYICSRKRVKQIGGRLVTFPFVKEKNNNNINKPRGLHSRPVQWKKLFIRTIDYASFFDHLFEPLASGVPSALKPTMRKCLSKSLWVILIGVVVSRFSHSKYRL